MTYILTLIEHDRIDAAHRTGGDWTCWLKVEIAKHWGACVRDEPRAAATADRIDLTMETAQSTQQITEFWQIRCAPMHTKSGRYINALDSTMRKQKAAALTDESGTAERYIMYVANNAPLAWPEDWQTPPLNHTITNHTENVDHGLTAHYWTIQATVNNNDEQQKDKATQTEPQEPQEETKKPDDEIIFKFPPNKRQRLTE